MSSRRTWERDPDSRLDWRWDWSGWLAEGEVITAATVTGPAGITVDDVAHDDTTVTAWVEGGAARKIYAVTCRIETNQGRIDDRSIRLYTTER